MNRHRRQKNDILTTLKDYAVPIVGVCLLILIIWSISSGGKKTEDPARQTLLGEELVSYRASFTQNDTLAQVVYSGGRREELVDDTEIFPGETIVVQEGRVKLQLGENGSIHLNRIAEFKIDGVGKYALYSSDAWIDSRSPVQVTMRYATINTGDNTIVSLTQNEAGSTIYVLKGSAQVQNSVGVETRVIAGQRLSIPRLQASNRDFDITSERVAIDTFFQNSDWFLENDGHLIQIQLDETTLNDEDDIGSETTSSANTSNFIRFDRLRDEMSVDSGSINVSGTLLSDTIGAISIQNTPVDLNVSAKSFNLDSIALPQAMNDIVVKIYDRERNILTKEVYTVYTSSPSRETTNTSAITSPSSTINTQTASSAQNTTHFDIDASKFRFTGPSTTGRFTTSSSEITIRGETTADGIARVEVNGFALNSFNGRTWRYHAFTRFDTIREGTNQYRVDYFDTNGKLVYTDFFTIIKQAPGATPVVNTQTSETTNTSTSPQNTTTTEEVPSQDSDIPLEPESLFGD